MSQERADSVPSLPSPRPRLVVKSQLPLKLVSFAPQSPREKEAASSYSQVREKQKPKEQGPKEGGSVPPSLKRPGCEGHIQSWHPGQRSVFTEKGWAPHSLYHLWNTYQETVKHTKLYYWEMCRQIINLLGTIKAFRCFWLQMLVTRTSLQTSFFSPFE